MRIIEYADDLPVLLSEYKSALGYEGTDHDTRLTALITEVVSELERKTDRFFISTVVEESFPAFSTEMFLPVPPLQSVEEITYYDSENESQTLDEESYYVISSDWTRGRVVFVDPPNTYVRPDAVTIQWVAGWTADTLPPVVKRVILSETARADFDRENQQQNFAASDRAISVIRNNSIV